MKAQKYKKNFKRTNTSLQKFSAHKVFKFCFCEKFEVDKFLEI